MSSINQYSMGRETLNDRNEVKCRLDRLENNFDPKLLEELQNEVKNLRWWKVVHSIFLVIVIAVIAAPLLIKDPEKLAPVSTPLWMDSPERCFKVVASKESDLEVTVLAGEQATVLLAVVNEACKIPMNSQLDLQCELVSKTNPGEAPWLTSAVNCSVKRINADQYEISYLCLPSVSPGKYQLLIKINERLIQGDPVNVSVLKKISKPINTIDKVNAPQGIAFNHRDEIIVAEYKNHSVSIFNTLGEKLRSFGSKGSGPGQFNHPCAVAVDDEDNILVVDGKNHRIQKFTPKGKYIREVGKHGTEPLEFNFPVGIGIHPLTKMIYVTENRNHRIQILYPNLTHFASIGGFDHNQTEFKEPKDVAFDSTGNVYVADNENHQIQVFTAEGKFKTKFGKEGKNEGELSYPSGVSIDSNDVLYVTELYNYRISRFELMGRFLRAFGVKGSGQGQFIDPRGIAVDKNGSIYVSDHGNDRIQVF